MVITSKISFLINRSEFSRYFWAGSLTFAADFTVLFLLTEIVGLNYLLSNLFGVCVGILLSYLLCIKWVFVNRRYGGSSFEFPAFVLTCIVGILLNELLLWCLVEYVSIHYLVSKVLVTLVIFVFNFLFKKVLLFTASN